MKEIIKIILGILGILGFGGWVLHEIKESEKERIKRIERENYLSERNYTDPVTIVSRNYQGKKYQRAQEIGYIATKFYKEKERAENELKEMARNRGCNLITEFFTDKETDNDGNYYYAVWKCSGLACKM